MTDCRTNASEVTDTSNWLVDALEHVRFILTSCAGLCCRASRPNLSTQESGVIASKNNDMMIVSEENNDPIDYLDEYIDDMSGQPLDSIMVKNARGEAMENNQAA